MRRVPIGLCEDYPEESRSLAEVRRDLELLAGAGVDVLRVSVGWDDLEPQDDRFVFEFWDQVVALAEARGVRLIPYVAYTPAWAVDGAPSDFWRQPPRDPAEFQEVLEVLARRYRGRIRSWELWNEPDNRDYWRGTDAGYARLLVAGAAGVRRGDPHAQVVSGGLAGDVAFLGRLLADQSAAAAIDVVNVHAYYETWNGEPLERLTDYLDEVAQAVRGAPAGRPDRPIWLAEVGYSNHRRGARVSAAYRATYAYEHGLPFAAVALVRTMTLALASPHVGLIAWYEVKDLSRGAAMIGDVNNQHLGVAFSDHRPKPALAALSFVARSFRTGYRTLDGELEVRSPAAAGDRRAARHELHAFLLADGSALLVAWIPTNPPHAPSPSGRAVDPRRKAVEVGLPCPGGAAAASLHDWRGQEVAPLPTRRAGDRVWVRLALRGGTVTIARVPACRSAG